MYCQNCGAKLKKNQAFCHSCGSSISSTSTAEEKNGDEGTAVIPQKQKLSKKKKWIIAAAIVLIVAAVIAVLAQPAAPVYELTDTVGMSGDMIKAKYGTPTETWEDGDSFEYKYSRGFAVSNIAGNFHLCMANDLVTGDVKNGVQICGIMLGDSFASVIANIGAPLFRGVKSGIQMYTYEYKDGYVMYLYGDQADQCVTEVHIQTTEVPFAETGYDLGNYIADNGHIYTVDELKEIFDVLSTEESEAGLVVKTSAATFILDSKTGKLLSVSPKSRLFNVAGYRYGDNIKDIKLEQLFDKDDGNDEATAGYIAERVVLDPYVVTVSYIKSSGLIIAISAQLPRDDATKGNAEQSAATATPVYEQYIGNWIDSDYQQYNMDISYGGGVYTVEISNSMGNSGAVYWYFSGEYDSTVGGIKYSDGMCYEYYYDDLGQQQANIEYNDSQGRLYLSGCSLIWEDSYQDLALNFSRSYY